MRLFIAVLFENEVIDEISALRDNLHERLGRAGWTKRENTHLTLEFLGECNAKERDKVLEIIEAIEFEPFEIVMDKVGYFKRKEGDTLYLAVRKEGRLLAIQSKMHKRLKAEGLCLDERAYKPHITLARRVHAGLTLDVKPITARVGKVSLMLSEFTGYGMKYTELN